MTMAEDIAGNKTRHCVTLQPDVVSQVDRYAQKEKIRSFSAAVERLVRIGLTHQHTVSEDVIAPAIKRVLEKNYPHLVRCR